jgi:hypothetical protein
MTKICPRCQTELWDLEYEHDHPEHYDGTSEHTCPKPECGYRVGRWTGRVLEAGEFEPRKGRRNGSGPLTPKLPVDYLGNTFTIGDEIVYPTRRGSQMKMNRATVTDVFDSVIKVRNATTGIVRSIERVDRVVIITNIIYGKRD